MDRRYQLGKGESKWNGTRHSPKGKVRPLALAPWFRRAVIAGLPRYDSYRQYSSCRSKVFTLWAAFTASSAMAISACQLYLISSNRILMLKH
jgi:hypothetical protein